MTGQPLRVVTTGQPLRVIFAVCSLRIGGTETQVVKMAIGLAQRGHDVRVVSLFGGGPLEATLAAAGVDVRVFGYPGVRSDGRGSRVSAGHLWRCIREL